MTDQPTDLAPHPGEPHRYTITCERCGERGFVNLAIVGGDEYMHVEPKPPPEDLAQLQVDVPPVDR